MARHWTPFHIPRRRTPTRRPPSDSPVAFAVSLGDQIQESVTLDRKVAEQLISNAKALELHFLPTIGLHGVTRIEGNGARGLEKDLRESLNWTQDPVMQEAIRSLLALIMSVRQNPTLSLLVAAGS